MITDLIHFLADCYQADFRAVNLLNFYNKKVSHQLLLDTAELVQGELTEYPVSTPWAKEVEKTLAIYSKEKALYCCSFFLAGTADIAGKEEPVLAPLYLYPAELLEDKGIYYVAIDAAYPLINPAIVEVDDKSNPGKYELLSSELPKGYFKFDNTHKLFDTLPTHFPAWNMEPLKLFPSLFSEAELKAAIKQAKHSHDFSFLPAVGLCLIDKPAGSRGILNELKAMTQSRQFSMPLHELLLQKWSAPAGKPLSDFQVPVILSQPQAGILANAGRYPLQLVVGPPGTGKSFTIAALAIELLSRGKFVLIASKNDEACNVVAEKIERDIDIPGVVVRANRRDYKSELIKRLQNQLASIDLQSADRADLRKQEKLEKSLHRTIQKLEAKIEALQQQMVEDGVFLHKYSGGILQNIQKGFVARRHHNHIPLWELTNKLEQLTRERHHVLRAYIKTIFNYHLGKALDNSRAELQSFLQALKARTGNRKEDYFDSTDFKVILRAFPIWTVNTADIHRVLPLQKDMFDLVIIDEATQCDIASSLSVLQRGKSALIVGDPKQLRHISFLSKAQQQLLADQHQLTLTQLERLNFRENSLLDLVLASLPSQQRIHFLNEHYRSMPDIIAFSNAQFYNNKLHVMTAKPHTSLRQHLFFTKIEGKRHDRGHHPAEAAQVMDSVRRIMESEAALEPTACQSIGIISPFREQVNHLQKLVDKQFSQEQVKRHRLMVGTPFGFQGEERDVVFLSFVLDDEAHPSAFRYANREDVFNVSITRARIQQQVLYSFEPTRLGTSLLRNYLTTTILYKHQAADSSQDIPFHDFLQAIKQYLIDLGVEQIHTAYSIAGVQVDLLVLHRGKSFGIDLIGHPGLWWQHLNLDEWKMLYRTGLPIFYLPYSEWLLQEEKVKKALSSYLGFQ